MSCPDSKSVADDLRISSEETARQRADAVTLLSRLVGDCREGTSDHAWRKCDHCLTIHEIQNHGGPAMRLLAVAIAALRPVHAPACQAFRYPETAVCTCGAQRRRP